MIFRTPSASVLISCVACSAARTQDHAAPAPPAAEPSATPEPSPEPAAASSARPATPAESATPVPNSPAPAPGAPASSAACAPGMLLVDGSYCDDLEMTCLKSWYADWNKKVVCERFQEPTRCVGAESKKRFCIDRYEFPNKKGVRPEVWNNFYEAQVLCAGLGKRLCTESEWTMACEGPARKPFPYGYVRDSKKCNGDRPYDFPSKKKLWKRDPEESERLWQGVLIGSQPECVSDYGVFDLPGNADELAASERPGGFDNVTTGGPWYLGVRNQCRPKIYTHDESFAYYYLSFRCCAEPDGKPTDPRSPKQLKRKMKWETVERFAKGSLSFKPRKK
jgi:formylglycine-generating enzyme